MLISKFSTNNVDEKIKEFEIAREIKIPKQLKQFLLKYNGGETPDTSFSCGGESSDIVAFYGLGDVKYSYNGVDIHDNNKDSLLPIACDSFGNDILIGLTSGEIYFRDHETNNFTKLAQDLRTFIENCISEAITPSETIKEREKRLISEGRENIITDELRALWQAEIDKSRAIMQEKVDF